VSTNKQLFRANYNVPMAQPSGLNLLEPTHTFYEGKMKTDTSYHEFFNKTDFKDMFKDRMPKVTREEMERKGQKAITKRIVFDHKSSTKTQFQHDPEVFRAVVLENQNMNKKDMFASKLQNNMRPRKNIIDDSTSAAKDENKNFVIDLLTSSLKKNIKSLIKFL
jgi:hypothetical protein